MNENVNDALNTMTWYVERYKREFAFCSEATRGLIDAYKRGCDLCWLYNEALKDRMRDVMGDAIPDVFNPPIMRAYHYTQGARAWFDSTLETAIAGGFDSMLDAYNEQVPMEDIVPGWNDHII